MRDVELYQQLLGLVAPWTGDGKGRNLEVVFLTALDGLAAEIRSSGACRSLSEAKG